MEKRVVITGLGAITPIGKNITESEAQRLPVNILSRKEHIMRIICILVIVRCHELNII